MNKETFDEAWYLLIHLAEQNIGHRIVDMEVLEEESEKLVAENKLMVLATLHNGRQMEICIHTFKTPTKHMAIHFQGNYI